MVCCLYELRRVHIFKDPFAVLCPGRGEVPMMPLPRFSSLQLWIKGQEIGRSTAILPLVKLHPCLYLCSASLIQGTQQDPDLSAAAFPMIFLCIFARIALFFLVFHLALPLSFQICLLILRMSCLPRSHAIAHDFDSPLFLSAP